MNKKIIIFVLFIILLIGVAGYLSYKGGMFSKEVFYINILGPEIAQVGKEIEYTVEYKNNSNFVLQKAKIVFELPENSLTEDGKTRFSENLKDIYPGQKESLKFKGRLLGKDGDLKTVKVSILYTPENITAQYESSDDFVTKIDASDISLEFSVPQKIEQGREFLFSINYLSGVDYPLENLSLKIDPLPGLEITSSDPKSLDNIEWKIGTLNKEQGGKINIYGKYSSGGDLNIVASIGKWKNGNFIVIKQISSVVKVISPQISVLQKINGSENYVASLGELVRFQIYFKNIGSETLDNPLVSVDIDESAFDMSSLEIEGGSAKIEGSIIKWSNLSSLRSQQQAMVSFSIKVRSDWNSVWGSNNETDIFNDVNVYQTNQRFKLGISID